MYSPKYTLKIPIQGKMSVYAMFLCLYIFVQLPSLVFLLIHDSTLFLYQHQLYITCLFAANLCMPVQCTCAEYPQCAPVRSTCNVYVYIMHFLHQTHYFRRRQFVRIESRVYAAQYDVIDDVSSRRGGGDALHAR